MTQQDHLERQLKRFIVEPSVDNGYVVRDLWSGASCDWHRFEQTLRQIGGKRLTYRVLTGKDDAGFMGLT